MSWASSAAVTSVGVAARAPATVGDNSPRSSWRTCEVMVHPFRGHPELGTSPRRHAALIAAAHAVGHVGRWLRPEQFTSDRPVPGSQEPGLGRRTNRPVRRELWRRLASAFGPLRSRPPTWGDVIGAPMAVIARLRTSCGCCAESPSRPEKGGALQVRGSGQWTGQYVVQDTPNRWTGSSWTW